MEHVVDAPGGRRRRWSGRGRRRRRRAVGDLLVRVGRRRRRGPRRRGRRRVDGSRPTWPRSAARHDVGLDAARPDAVERRRRTGQRTARENVDDLVDPGSFVEYGPLVIAAQRRRRELEDLIERTPADGLVAGIGTVDGQPRRRDVLRLHGAGRHPGPAEPPQEGPAVRAGRAAAAAGRVLHRGRRRAAGRHRRHRRVRPRLPGLPPVRPAVGPRARWSASPPAAASPATPPSSAAATSSSPPRARTSAWAARR